MIYLYIKTHNKTGLKYLGKTTVKDPYAYTGSGVHWKRHIKINGYDVTTEILLATEDKQELKETGIFFSKLWNVVNSDEWANLMEEKGDGISSFQATKENDRRVKQGTHPFSGSLNNKMTNEKRQETKRRNGTHNFAGGKIQKKRVSEGTHHLLGGDVQRNAMNRIVSEGKHVMQQGKILVVDNDGNTKFMDKEEYKIQTELVHVNSKEGKRRLGKPEQPSVKQLEYWNRKKDG